MTTPPPRLSRCAACRKDVVFGTDACPHCGERILAGFEYRSRARLFGLPLVHVALGFDPTTGRQCVARGIFAFGAIAKGAISATKCASISSPPASVAGCTCPARHEPIPPKPYL